jgi:phosphatidylinositol 4-phosphatase
VKEVDEEFKRHGYFFKSAAGEACRWQSGVLRTNCMDNLDRTNVVQSLFARRSLLVQLESLVADKEDVLNSPFPEFEKVRRMKDEETV